MLITTPPPTFKRILSFFTFGMFARYNVHVTLVAMDTVSEYEANILYYCYYG